MPDEGVGFRNGSYNANPRSPLEYINQQTAPQVAQPANAVPSLSAWGNNNALPNDNVVNVYIPRMVQDFIDDYPLRAGFTRGNSTGLATNGVVMFVSLTNSFALSPQERQARTIPPARLNSLQNLFQSIMTLIHANGGDLVNILYDDKGCTLIAVFPRRLPV